MNNWEKLAGSPMRLGTLISEIFEGYSDSPPCDYCAYDKMRTPTGRRTKYAKCHCPACKEFEEMRNKENDIYIFDRKYEQQRAACKLGVILYFESKVEE